MLRHQLIVLQRSVARPKLRPMDRLLWAAGLRRLPNWREFLVIVQPETVIRWHRMGSRGSGVGAALKEMAVALPCPLI